MWCPLLAIYIIADCNYVTESFICLVCICLELSLVSLKYKWCSFSCSSIIDRKPHNITSSRWKMVPYQPKYVVSNYKQKSGTERELINHTIWLIKGCKCNNLKAVPLLCNIQTFSSSIYSWRGSRAVKVHSRICFLLSLTHFSTSGKIPFITNK